MIYFKKDRKRVDLIQMKECIDAGGVVVFETGYNYNRILIDCESFDQIAEAGEEDDITYETMVYPPPKYLMEQCNHILDIWDKQND